ncbi:hypothetical protein [Alcaligenes sp. SDU_A2]|uniref:hypothetical protein n=1 Tax=Alcaligenes sp. SDU_A2 TaxID=3136634 RepID=UPI00311F8D3A
MAEKISESDFFQSVIRADAERVDLIFSSLDGDLMSGYRGDLRFHPETAGRIKEKFIELRKEKWDADLDWLKREARSFVDGIRDIARTAPATQKYEPDNQRQRKERLESIGKHVNALADLMNDADSMALGWLLVQFFAIHENDDEPGKDPMKAQAMALHTRKFLREILPDLGLAAIEASKTLPLADRPNPYLTAGLILNRRFYDAGLLEHFKPEKNSFGWLCMSEMMMLMGAEDSDKTSYWLRKTIEDPESTTAWIEGLRKRAVE